MVFDLRDDIKHRDDAGVFYECIRLVGRTTWCRDKSFKRKLSKGNYEYYQPGFGEISENTYEHLHPAVKKYFSEVRWYHKNWNPYRKTYECKVPSYFFVTKIEPRWVTHYKEHDGLIAQQENEIRDVINSGKMLPVNSWYADRPGYSSYAKARNRSDRKNSKETLKRNVLSGGDNMDKYEYRYNHKHSARWDYW
jgi:hypothetical protein